MAKHSKQKRSAPQPSEKIQEGAESSDRITTYHLELRRSARYDSMHNLYEKYKAAKTDDERRGYFSELCELMQGKSVPILICELVPD